MLKDESICNFLSYSMQMLEEKVCTEEGRRISDSAVETDVNQELPRYCILHHQERGLPKGNAAAAVKSQEGRCRFGKTLVLLWKPDGASNDEAL
jgi:hypothetical protein